MGETWEDRLDMAVSLAELEVDSIPINALMPIPGTPLEHLPQLTEDEILRTIAFFRYINPKADIRLAAGRALLTNDGERAFAAVIGENFLYELPFHLCSICLNYRKYAYNCSMCHDSQ